MPPLTQNLLHLQVSSVLVSKATRQNGSQMSQTKQQEDISFPLKAGWLAAQNGSNMTWKQCARLSETRTDYQKEVQ